MNKRPDFILKAVNKNTEKRTRVGAAWVNPNRSISVKIDPFVVLQETDGFHFMLYPQDEANDKEN